jgi:hypothetical protein
MDTVKFLENLANHTHYSKNISSLINRQPSATKKAFLNKNTKQLQQQISSQEYFAHETHVIQSLIYDFNGLIKY